MVWFNVFERLILRGCLNVAMCGKGKFQILLFITKDDYWIVIAYFDAAICFISGQDKMKWCVKIHINLYQALYFNMLYTNLNKFVKKFDMANMA